MQRLWWILILILLGVASADNLALPIMAVQVSGNRIYSDEDILARAHVRLRPGMRFDQAVVQEDMQRIMSIGSFSRVAVEVVPERSGVILSYIVSENPLIEKVVFSRNTEIPEKELLRHMSSKPGTQLQYSLIDKDVRYLNRMYKRQGYELSSVSRLDLVTGNVLAVTMLEPVVQEVIISGNLFTNEELLLRECETKPGTIYNAKTLYADRNRLFGLGYFSMVSLPELLPAETPEAVVVRITVQEKKKNTINVGFGVSSKEEFGFARLSLLNILGTGEQLQFSIQSGREYRGASKYPKVSYRFRYFNPWIFQRDLSLGYTRYLNRNYESLKENTEVVDIIPVQRDGFSVDMGFPLPFGRQYQFITEYRDEAIREISSLPRVQYTNRSLSGTYIYNGLSLLEQSSVYGDGEYFSFKIEKGGAYRAFNSVLFGLGGVDFTRVELKYNRYYALTGDNNVLGFNYRAGTFVAPLRSNVLEGEEYTVGGSSTVRGYPDIQPFAIGPKMTIINVEYTYLFTPGWQGVIFYDWGNAFESMHVSVKQFKSGAGVGLRIGTPVGPIRFDLGRGDQYWVLHLGLGYMF